MGAKDLLAQRQVYMTFIDGKTARSSNLAARSAFLFLLQAGTSLDQLNERVART